MQRVLRLCLPRLSGLTAEGEKKIRPIDDLSRSGVNANTAASEKLRNDSLDVLVECSSQLRCVAGGGDREVGSSSHISAKFVPTLLA